MDKENVVYIYIRDCVSGMKSDVMPFAARRMDVEIIILREVN